MGGGNDKVEETELEKELAQIAKEQWDIYENDLQGFETNFIDRVSGYNTGSNMESAKSTVDQQYAQAFSNAKLGVANKQLASGVNPNSGKFKQGMADLQTQQTLAQGDTVNRSQVGEQDKYIAGLQDVVAIGQGEKSEALSGLSDSANLSQQKAINDSTNAYNASSANQQLIGAVGGATAGYFAGQKTTPLDKVADLRAGSASHNDYQKDPNPSPGLRYS